MAQALALVLEAMNITYDERTASTYLSLCVHQHREHSHHHYLLYCYCFFLHYASLCFALLLQDITLPNPAD